MNEPIAYLITFLLLIIGATGVIVITQHLHMRAYRQHCEYLATLLKAAEERNKRATQSSRESS
jgi:hypothetical protein